MSTVMQDLPCVRRVPRSQAALRVNDLLSDLVRRGELQHVHFGNMRVGRMTHRIRWHCSRELRFVLDLDASAVMFPALLPAPLSPQVLRELQGFLRANATNANRTGRLDSNRGELRVFVQHGSLSLSVTVRNNAYEYCTDRLMRLGEEILTAFVDQSVYEEYRSGHVAGSQAQPEPRSE